MEAKEELPTRYEPNKIEPKWYQFWLDQKIFSSKSDVLRPYCVLTPPCNRTGGLHMGHSLNVTIQDILVRAKKLQGYNTLFLPGTDHGAIATQNVVERELLKENIRKEDLGREEFLNRVNAWAEDKRNIIVSQIQRLGASCDWDREQYTMSPELSQWVRRAFVKLYEKNLIYQDDKMINWCSRCGTALANDEVDHKEKNGFLYFVKYPILGTPDKYITVATTRPETIFGDVAIAYHPDDERYRDLVNYEILIPIVGRTIPLISDNYVDPNFGSGLVKITPAHDPNDFLVGQRHSLPSLTTIDEKGMICNTRTHHDGTDRFICRKLFVKELEEAGYLEKIQDHKHSVGVCYRCDTVVESRVSKQWFLRMDLLATKALEWVNSGQVNLIPDHHLKLFNHWFSENRDWCISRQIWFGHQIPVWRCETCEQLICTEEEKLSECLHCGSHDVKQDEDVLDTWFSSALWPFSVWSTPEDLAYYYPTSVLVTGGDILFFWVARMLIMSGEFQDLIPFHDVYLHGIVRDHKGEKMSKSKGNGIDPLEIIKVYGADALRMTFAFMTPKGRDVKISLKSFEVGQQFCTKLWNAFRFLLMNLDVNKVYSLKNFDQEHFGSFDRWILNKFNLCLDQVNHYLDNYDIQQACQTLYRFTWDEFCAVYLEFTKTKIQEEQTQKVLLKVLDSLLIMLHPFIPHLTEELWQRLQPMIDYHVDKTSIMTCSWPSVINIPNWDPIENSALEMYQRTLEHIRTIRGELKIKPKTGHFILISDEGLLQNYFKTNHEVNMQLTKLGSLTYESPELDKKKYLLFNLNDTLRVFVELTKEVDLSSRITDLEKQLAETDKKSKKCDTVIDHPDIPEKKKEKSKEEKNILTRKIEAIKKEIMEFKRLI